jgi:ABC-2 type transport system ATP-binding protein
MHVGRGFAAGLPRANARADQTQSGAALIEVENVSRRFGALLALDSVSMAVEAGEIRALLGPNGAGKTTLLRVLCGLAQPTDGVARVGGADPGQRNRGLLDRIGLVPSGDRTFYARLSGLENLAFFGRLHGWPRTQALRRAWELLEEVAMVEAAKAPVQTYSHGMQKRLSVARALLRDPLVLLVDEATHDLDPDSAHRIRELIRARALSGAAVLWATQRIEEIWGFARSVTLLHRGQVRFAGSVPQLAGHAEHRRYVVALRHADGCNDMEQAAATALGRMASVAPADTEGSEYFLLSLSDGIVLGDAITTLTGVGIQVLSCREERGEIEEAFLALTGTGGGV